MSVCWCLHVYWIHPYKLPCCTSSINLFQLGADHLTLEKGGGWVGDFEKKFPASARRKKKIACSTNVIEKKLLRCCRKKMLQSYFIIPGVFKKSQQNCNHSFPLLTLNSGFDDAAKLLLHMCNALLAYHKQYYKMEVNFFLLKNQV